MKKRKTKQKTTIILYIIVTIMMYTIANIAVDKILTYLENYYGIIWGNTNEKQNNSNSLSGLYRNNLYNPLHSPNTNTTTNNNQPIRSKKMKEQKQYEVELKLKVKKPIEIMATSEDNLEEKIHELITENLWDFIDFDYEREPYTEEELEEIKADQEYDRIHG